MKMIGEQLRTAREMLKSSKGKEQMLSIISHVTGKPALVYPAKDHRFTYFNYSFNGHSYRGYIFNPMRSSWQGDLYGTIFYMWDNSPHIVRGYPKINYTQVSSVMNREVVAEEKVDGTNIIFFNFPNGKLMGKTRATPRYDLGGWMGRMWHELAGNTGRLDGIRKLTNDDYHPVVELYGYLNQCEYIDYPDVPIDMMGLDIIDSRTFCFLPYNKKKQLFEGADIPMPALHWKGVLDTNDLTYLENEAESLMGKYEGFVAKYWSPLYNDQFFGKIKCEAMKELARLRSGGAIPTPEIDKAIRKALGNVSLINSVSELHSMVLEDLYSEFDQHHVDVSLVRIEKTIAKAFPVDTLQIWSVLNSLENTIDVTMDNKATVMRHLSNMLSTLQLKINPSHQYKAFILYLKKEGKIGE